MVPTVLTVTRLTVPLMTVVLPPGFPTQTGRPVTPLMPDAVVVGTRPEMETVLPPEIETVPDTPRPLPVMATVLLTEIVPVAMLLTLPAIRTISAVAVAVAVPVVYWATASCTCAMPDTDTEPVASTLAVPEIATLPVTVAVTVWPEPSQTSAPVEAATWVVVAM